jgi:hypothetical protein
MSMFEALSALNKINFDEISNAGLELIDEIKFALADHAAKQDKIIDLLQKIERKISDEHPAQPGD